MQTRVIFCFLLIVLGCSRNKAPSRDSQETLDASPSMVSASAVKASRVDPVSAAGTETGLPVQAADESDAGGSARKAILDGLRKEVQRQYAGSKTLATAELVFVVKTLRSDEKFAYVYAEAFRKTSAGNVKIVQKDFEGTKFATLSQDGVFDGPTVIAVLAKGKEEWSVARFPKGDDKGQPALALGPTDFPGEYYLEMFGLPKAWLR